MTPATATTESTARLFEDFYKYGGKAKSFVVRSRPKT